MRRWQPREFVGAFHRFAAGIDGSVDDEVSAPLVLVGETAAKLRGEIREADDIDGRAAVDELRCARTDAAVVVDERRWDRPRSLSA
nr:hypothetical protein [Haloterrigena gelatinilytica]